MGIQFTFISSAIKEIAPIGSLNRDTKSFFVSKNLILSIEFRGTDKKLSTGSVLIKKIQDQVNKLGKWNGKSINII